MIRYSNDREVRQTLAALTVPNPLTVDSLFAVMRDHYQTCYSRALELWRGASPFPQIHANALWLTRPHADSDVVWLDPALTGAAAVHSLGHEFGHQALRHKPLELPTEPRQAETYEFLSSEFLDGCLFGRARSHDGPQDPEYVRVEDAAERFAFLLRRTAADQARDTRHHDPLVGRLHDSL
ncbi:hypothetical protein [Streptomyces sp. NPDC001068]|uniref:hypothetical protein n=1 Tax=Streptomyces sp. NPDC001068 TaxID=3364544 RepID=UPI0036B102EB